MPIQLHMSEVYNGKYTDLPLNPHASEHQVEALHHVKPVQLLKKTKHLCRSDLQETTMIIIW